ncbi:MAG TPA: alpha/beta fold hydrolase [Solirubrobacterales bacterium]|nr:alpha/beta fold hydrolase [Solirubrobacterales bacterium]
MGVHSETTGAGDPLVLLHGLGGTHSVWEPVMPAVAPRRQAIAIDLPGFGRSPPLKAGAGPTPLNLARAIADHCRELGIERPHAGGISLGGWVALELAKLGAVASVTALSPAGLWARAPGPRRLERRRAAALARPLLEAALTSRRGRRLLLRGTVAHPDRVPPDAARELVTGWLDAPGYAATSHEMRRGVFEHDGLVDVPVTIAWAERDRVVSRPRPERIPPGARYLTLPGCGHISTWDDPARVAGLLLQQSAPERSALLS